MAGVASASPAAATRSGVPSTSGATQKTIVLLRAQGTQFPARSTARASALQAAEAPVVSAVKAAGVKVEATGRQLPYVVASLTAAQREALAANPDVQAVVPDATIPNPFRTGPTEPTVPHAAATGNSAAADPPSICGTASSPEQDPEALSVINAPSAWAQGYNGAGVRTAYMAGPIDTTVPDFQRNAAYASSGSATGSPVVTNVNFTGQPDGAPTGEAADESFIDAGSIVAQGNTTYDLNGFINSSHTLPSTPCDISVTGDAPGASVTGLDVFGDSVDTTTSNFIQAIDYAVANGVLVINQSFGANQLPDTVLDAVRIADDDAVAEGVTVVASTGDAGVTSTIGSPATDPNVISVGASTTFRSYEQNFFGGINATSPNANNGTWINNNISSLSSGGFAQGGGTTGDLVAPGDLNWGLCSNNQAIYTACADENGNPTLLQQVGGTSESAPLTAGAAADVIQAYASTHGGTLPSPALVKQILISTASDIFAPAEQQGAGLLNIGAAVAEATHLPGSSSPSSTNSGLLISPNQINITQAPGATTSRPVRLTNTGTSPVTVNLSTRALTHQVAQTNSSFCLNPSASSGPCGPPTANTFRIWSGATEVYQEETFSVPATSSPSRLDFSAAYPVDNPPQGSLLHVALYDPSGSYAGYSLPQGFGDYANIQVANPAAGTWTAVFFTFQDTAGESGTSGVIDWQATTSEFQPAGQISPSTLTIAPGATGTATFTATSPAASGDTAQSIVIDFWNGAANTIPVTVRTTIPTTSTGGHFSGTLTGGNGRGNPAVMNTYVFSVPSGLRDVDASVSFPDINNGVVAYLVDPAGEAVASSSSLTTDAAVASLVPTGAVNVYKDTPQAGQWKLVLDWLQPQTAPVAPDQLTEPFTGTIKFNGVSVSSNLPTNPGTALQPGHTYTFHVTVKNNGASPQDFFLDPRTPGTAVVRLADLNGSDQNMSLPLAAGLTFPLYIVPTDTNGIEASLTGSVPVSFDIDPFTGDPDLSPATGGPGVLTSQDPFRPSLQFESPSSEVMPGLWLLNPSEIGPYPSAGAQPATASANFSAITKAFDPTVNPSTGDLWAAANGITDPASFNPVYLNPGQSASIPLHITPSAPAGTLVHGFTNVDDTFLFNTNIPFLEAGGDELASIPFTYRVAPHPTATTLKSSANPGRTNTTTTLTATVLPPPDGGTMAFTDNGKTIPTCRARPVNPSTGQATCAVNYITTGKHTVVATYAGDFAFARSTSAPLAETVIAGPPPKEDLWLTAADGSVVAYGDPYFGSLKGVHLTQPIVGMASTPDGRGYWLVARDGGVFAFGDAHFYGSTGRIHLSKPIVGITPDPATGGYWLVASDGGVFSFHAPFLGSTGNIRLNKPVVGMAATADGLGYWLVASDGGIFTFGDARFHGSTGNVRLAQPIVGMAADTLTGGYWMVARDGGIFAFDAPFFGSAGASHLAQPVIGMGETADLRGYWIATSGGAILHYGDAAALPVSGGSIDLPAVGMASVGPPPNSI